MSKLNFLIIQADQLTAQVLAPYGRAMAKTPHIDALAAGGVVFRNSYCTYPLCGPSRMSMMAGRMASRIGVYDNAAEFRAEIPTFCHYLRARGYRTTLSGKMHFVGPDQLHGFEERLTSDIYPADFTWTENLQVRDKKHKSDARGVTRAGVCDRSVQLDYDELAMFRAEQHLYDLASGRDERPFLLFVSLTHPHEPFYCTQPYWNRYRDDEIPMPTVGPVPIVTRDPLTAFINERYELDVEFGEQVIRRARRGYLGSVSYVDDKVGALVAMLKRLRLYDDTVIVLLSDHGEMLGERGMWFKRHLFEWSAKVPLIFHAPQRFATAARDEAATLMDLLPTLLALSGDETLTSLVEPIEGRSLLGLLNGQATGWDNVAYAETMSDGLPAPVFMIRRDNWKLIWGTRHSAQLFDLTADPDEQVDLASRSDGPHKAVLATLMAEAARIWDGEALQRDIDRSIARRLLVRGAHRQGKAPVWDYPSDPTENARWCRAGSDYSGWAFDVLNPR